MASGTTPPTSKKLKRLRIQVTDHLDLSISASPTVLNLLFALVGGGGLAGWLFQH